MPIEVGDLVLIKHQWTVNGEASINTYWYHLVNKGVPDALLDAMVEDWWSEHSPTLRAFQHAGVINDKIIGQNLMGDLDYFEYNIPTGERVGTFGALADPWPTFQTVSVKFARASQNVRSRNIGLYGAGEGQVDAYGDLTAAYIATIGAYLDVLVDGFQEGLLGVNEYELANVRDPYNASLMRYIETVTGYVIAPKVSTQNHRKQRT